MHISRGILIVFCSLLFLPFENTHAKPENLAALFQTSKKPHKKAKIPPRPALSHEYLTYIKAKKILDQTSDLGAIESIEQQLLLIKVNSESRALERELDDVFYALEMKRARALSKKKLWARSLSSVQRALNGLAQFKWIYFWKEENSKSLASVCNRNKKKKDELCLALAKRVVDAFPKAANETKVLRELSLPESVQQAENSGDRLSQTYTEKFEKDEDAFKEVLESFLSGERSGVLRSGEAFIKEYPKSILRFRVQFLMAETQFQQGDLKEAEAKYKNIIDQVPLSFYAIVSSERLGISLKDQVKKTPIQIDSEQFNTNLFEKQSLERAKILLAHHQDDEVGIELDSLSRVRFYQNDLLLYLMKLAAEANQNLVAFKFANELIQRKYDGLLNQEFLDLIFPDRFTKEIETQAALNQVDPLLIASLMKQESGYKASVLSSSGALGLMQLMPFTAIDTKKDVVLSSLKEPAQNIAVGTKYFASLFTQHGGNIPYALAAYNAGPHRVAKWRKDAKPDASMVEWIEAIPYKETRDYVMSILRNRYWYQVRKGMVPESVFSAWKKI